MVMDVIEIGGNSDSRQFSEVWKKTSHNSFSQARASLGVL